MRRYLYNYNYIYCIHRGNQIFDLKTRATHMIRCNICIYNYARIRTAHVYIIIRCSVRAFAHAL